MTISSFVSDIYISSMMSRLLCTCCAENLHLCLYEMGDEVLTVTGEHVDDRNLHHSVATRLLTH